MLPLALLLPLFGGKKDDEIARLQAEVIALQAEVISLQAQAADCQRSENALKDEEARALAALAKQKETEGDLDAARGLYQELVDKYPLTSSGRAAMRTLSELQVIGLATPKDWSGHVTRWFQGKGEVDLEKGVTIVVFFEEWCPHCGRELPQLDATLQVYGPQGLQVLGLTKITKSSTVESVGQFLTENQISFPIAQEDGELSKLYAVTGIPAAVVIKDGVAVWRGHPARIDGPMLEGWLGN